MGPIASFSCALLTSWRTLLLELNGIFDYLLIIIARKSISWQMYNMVKADDFQVRLEF